MGIVEQIEKYHKLLVPHGHYTNLGIFDITNCAHLAGLFNDSYHLPDSKIFIFHETYKIPENHPSSPEFGERINFKDKFKLSPGQKLFFKNLYPLPLKETNQIWSAHFVYSSQNIVYDPILGKPAHIDEYSLLMFGENIDKEIYISKI